MAIGYLLLLATGYIGCALTAGASACILTTVPCDLEGADPGNDMAARNKSTHRANPEIKGTRYWATKGTFFENMIFLSIFKFASSIVVNNVLSASKTPQVNPNSRGSYLLSLSESSYTEIVLKMYSAGRKTPKYPQIREEVSSWALFPGRVAVHRNSPQKYTEWVEKPPRYSWNSKAGYLLGISILPYTEIVLKNEFSGSKNPLCTVKFARKYPPGRVAVHPKRVLRNVLSRSKNRQVHSNSRENHLLGISVSPYTEIVLKSVLSGSKYPQVHSNLC